MTSESDTLLLFNCVQRDLDSNRFTGDCREVYEIGSPRVSPKCNLSKPPSKSLIGTSLG